MSTRVTLRNLQNAAAQYGNASGQAVVILFVRHYPNRPDGWYLYVNSCELSYLAAEHTTAWRLLNTMTLNAMKWNERGLRK
jgi:hypothetical protein